MYLVTVAETEIFKQKYVYSFSVSSMQMYIFFVNNKFKKNYHKIIRKNLSNCV